MSSIQIRGPFAVWWGAWHLARLAGLFWGSYLGYWHGLTAEIHLFFTVLYSAFLPAEALGAYLEAKANARGEPEVARTLSQTNQWVSHQGKGPLAWGKSVAMMSGALDAANVTMILSPYNPWVAIIVGAGVAFWLIPHYSFRQDVG